MYVCMYIYIYIYVYIHKLTPCCMHNGAFFTLHHAMPVQCIMYKLITSSNIMYIVCMYACYKLHVCMYTCIRVCI